MIIAIVKADNSVHIYHEDIVDTDFIQGVVGEWVDVIHSPIMNMFHSLHSEETKGLPHNAIATIMWELALGVTDDFIAGDVVITGPADFDKDDTDLNMAAFELIAQAVSIGVMRADAEWRRN